MTAFDRYHYLGETDPSKPPAVLTVTYQCGHYATFATRSNIEGDCQAPGMCPKCAIPTTVKRPDLFGNVTDTHQTETELNGFRASQGALL